MNTQQHNDNIKKCHEAAVQNGWWEDLPSKVCIDHDEEKICKNYISDEDAPTYCKLGPDRDHGEGGNIQCAWRNEWLADKIDLISGEGAEAIEALRKGRRAGRDEFEQLKSYPKKDHDKWIVDTFKWHIKDSFEDEVADIYIRTCDLMGFYGMKYDSVSSGGHYGRLELQIRNIRRVALDLAMDVEHDGKTPDNGWDLSLILNTCIAIAQLENFDLQWHVDAKLQYNQTRGKKHGKEF